MTDYIHHIIASTYAGVSGECTDDWSRVTCPSCLRERKDTAAMPIPFTLTNENITVILDGKPHTIHAGTPQFHGLRDALFREDWNAIPTYVSRSGALQQWLGDKFVVDGERISFASVELPESLQARIWAMVTAGESPAPLFAFYERLHKNPSFRSRTMLHSFMQHTGIPIEADGMFLAYKGIKHDYTDGHTGTIDNSPGMHHSMPRNLISDDPNKTCHFGFHVGALGYAGSFSDRTVVVRVDPEHVVCVPNDFGAQKMRVCDYTVVANHDGVTPMPSTTIKVDVEEQNDPAWGGDVEGEDQDDRDLTASQDDDDDALAPGPHVVAMNGVTDGVTEVPPGYTMPAWKTKAVVLTSKPTGPKAASFNRMKPGTLMDQSIDDLRKYAAAHLKILGASKLPGGKSALVAKILKARRRRRA